VPSEGAELGANGRSDISCIQPLPILQRNFAEDLRPFRLALAPQACGTNARVLSCGVQVARGILRDPPQPHLQDELPRRILLGSALEGLCQLLWRRSVKLACHGRALGPLDGSMPRRSDTWCSGAAAVPRAWPVRVPRPHVGMLAP